MSDYPLNSVLWDAVWGPDTSIQKTQDKADGWDIRPVNRKPRKLNGSSAQNENDDQPICLGARHRAPRLAVHLVYETLQYAWLKGQEWKRHDGLDPCAWPPRVQANWQRFHGRLPQASIQNETWLWVLEEKLWAQQVGFGCNQENNWRDKGACNCYSLEVSRDWWHSWVFLNCYQHT